MRLVLLGLVWIAVSASAQGKGPAGYRGVPLTAWQEFHADKAFASIYFRGDGTVPITVNTVTVVGCSNTREVCGDYPVELRVAPGQVVEALQLHRLDAERNWSFTFHFKAGKHKVSIDDPPLPDAHAPVPVSQLETLGPEILTHGTCGGPLTASLPPKHRLLEITFTSGEPPPRARTRIVTAWFDASGSAYRYEDRRVHPDIQLLTREKGITLRSVMYSPEPEVLIRLDIAGDSGTVVTSREDSTNVIRIVGPGLLTSDVLGRPGELIAKLWKECR